MCLFIRFRLRSEVWAAATSLPTDHPGMGRPTRAWGPPEPWGRGLQLRGSEASRRPDGSVLRRLSWQVPPPSVPAGPGFAASPQPAR